MNRRPEEKVSLGWLRLLDVIYSRIYHRIDVQTPCQLPRTGPGILVCNHISGLDPVLIQAICPRLIVWMMAEEYAHLPLLGPLFKAVQTISVRRTGHDLAATRAALRALDAGLILGIFPEGRIETGRDLLPFQPGVAVIAQRTRVPIYPTRIDGTSRGVEMPEVFLHRQEICLRFGRRLMIDPRLSLDEAIRQVRSAVINMDMENVRPGQKGKFFRC